MKLVKIFPAMFRIFVVCFPFCLPSSSAAAATAATATPVDDDGKQKCSSSSDHVTIETNHDNLQEPLPPINNSRFLAMITAINLVFQQHEIRFLAMITAINLVFQQHEIGKTAMGYVPAILVVLLINRALFPQLALNFVVITFALGFVIIWNGILFRSRFPRFSCVAEIVGVVVVFMGFFGLIAAVLPLSLVWAPVLCAVLFLLPILLSCVIATLPPTDGLPAAGQPA